MDEVDIRNKRFESISIEGTLSFEEVLGQITDYFGEDPDAHYKISVGTDSNAKVSDGYTNFVTVIHMHRVGRGARYFLTHRKKVRVGNEIAPRLYKEAQYTYELAMILIPILKEISGLADKQVSHEVHVDVGQHGKSKGTLDGIVGMMRGSGLICVTKPDAYAATTVADRHV